MADSYVLFNDGTRKKVKTSNDAFSNDAFAEWLDATAGSHQGIAEINVPEFDPSQYKNLTGHLKPVSGMDLGGDSPNHVAKQVTIKNPFAPPGLRETTASPLAARTMIDTLAKEGGEFAGSVGGGALGSLAPGMTGPGAVAGAGAGRAAGAKASDMYGESIGLPPRQSNLAGEGLRGMAWETGGRAIPALMGAAWRWSGRAGVAAEETADVLRRFRNIGVNPMRWQLAESGPTSMLFNWSRNHPMTARKIADDLRDQIDETMEGIETRISREMQGVEQLPDVRATSRELTGALGDVRARKRGWKIQAQARYNRASAYLPDNPTWRPTATKDGLMTMDDAMRDTLEVATLPAEAKRMLGSLTSEGRAGQLSLPGGGSVSAPINMQTLIDTRSAVRKAGRSLNKASDQYTVRQENLKKIERMLTEDIEAGYKHHGGDKALTEFKNADKYYATQQQLDRTFLKGIADKIGIDSPRKVYRRVENLINSNDADAVALLRGRLGGNSAEWDHLVDQYMRDRLVSGRGNIDFDAFLKMRDDIGKSSSMEKMILGGKGSAQREYWDDLTKFFEDNRAALKQAEKHLSESNTKGVISNIAASGPFALIGGGAAFGATQSPTAAAAAALAIMTMGPEAAWKMVKQPKIMRVFMDAPDQKIVSLPAKFNQLGRIIGGLDEDEYEALLEFFATSEAMFGGGADKAQTTHPLTAGVFGGR